MKWIRYGPLALGVLWLAVLVLRREVRPPLLLDVILPPRVLELTTAEERIAIADALRGVLAPSPLPWIGAVSLILVGILNLKAAAEKHTVSCGS